MHFNQLMYYYETVKAQSISAAAQNLHISQPALSKAIKGLENDLGQPLLIRTNRGVYPTPIGEKVYADIIVLQEMISGWRVASDIKDIQAQIHIGCISCSHSHLLQHIIHPFHCLYPKIDIVMHELYVHPSLRSLKNMPFHIAITSIPSFRHEQYSAQAQEMNWPLHHLFTDERRILIGATHPLAQKDALTVDDLKTLVIAYYSTKQDVVSTIYEPYFYSSYKLPNKESIMELVLNNQVVFTPVFHLIEKSDYYIKNHLVKSFALPIQEISSAVPIIAVVTDSLSTAEHLFFDYLLENFALSLS